ncbi:unnamed protein product [Agarophyton chilense]
MLAPEPDEEAARPLLPVKNPTKKKICHLLSDRNMIILISTMMVFFAVQVVIIVYEGISAHSTSARTPSTSNAHSLSVVDKRPWFR